MFSVTEPVGEGAPPKSAEVVIAGLEPAPAPEPESGAESELEPVEPEGTSGALVTEGATAVGTDAEVEVANVGTAVAVPSAPMMTT